MSVYRSIARSLTILVPTLLLSSAPAFAQCDPTEIAKLLASDGAAFDQFGISVSISGDTAIVGADNDDDRGSLSGSAYIFERIAGVWTQTSKLLASDGAAGDEFGISVSLSGDTAIVGADGDDDRDVYSGSAYIFERIGGVWTQTSKLLASDGAAYDFFGSSVSLSGDTAIVGARWDDDRGTNSGSAYIFERIGGVWTQTSKLRASDGAAFDFFGFSVSLSGDTAIVGAYQDDDRGSNSGSAYIFERIGGVWTQTSKLLASDGAAGDYFGFSVSLSGDTAIVGAYLDDAPETNSGSAYIFERIGGVWTQTSKLLASDGALFNYFGFSVSLSGDTAIVGASLDDDRGFGSGSAYIFERIGGVWTQTSKLLASDGAANDFFGRSVSLSGDTAIVGAYQDDDRGSNSGSAYIFQLNCDPSLLVSPDPLQAGQDALFTAVRLTPSTRTHLVFSVRGPGSTFVPPLNITIDLNRPKQIGPALMTDANGQVQWTLHVPSVSDPINIWFQAVQFENKTNVVATQIVP